MGSDPAQASGSVEAPPGSVEAPPGSVEAPPGSAQASGSVEARPGSVEASVGRGAAVRGAAVRGIARNLDRGTVLAERLETASSFWGKLMGLMGRPSLPAGDGLWLPGGNGIHMMFMRFPIDAVFLSKPGAGGLRTVRSVHRGLRAWTGVVWLVRGADGVIELPVGTIDATGTAVGDRVEVHVRG